MVHETHNFQLVGFPGDEGGIVLSLHDPVSIFFPRQLEFHGLFCKRRQSCTKRSQERTKFKTTGGYMAKTAVQYFPLKVCVLKVFNSLLFPCEGKHKQLVVVWKTLVHCKVIIIKSLMKGAALHIPQVQLSRWFRNAVLQSKNHTAELCSYEAF